MNDLEAGAISLRERASALDQEILEGRPNIRADSRHWRANMTAKPKKLLEPEVLNPHYEGADAGHGGPRAAACEAR